MEIGAADGRTGDLEDDITVFKGSGLRDFGCCEVQSLVREDRVSREVEALIVLTKFDAILAHPDEGLHLLARRVCVLFTVATRVGHILLGNSIVTMAECFLDQV